MEGRRLVKDSSWPFWYVVNVIRGRTDYPTREQRVERGIPIYVRTAESESGRQELYKGNRRLTE